MIATNVEELINLLETFDFEESLYIGSLRGKLCIFIGESHIILPSSYNI